MDIHKPKPWHGVREFLKEIGTIVIGVLIALGGEQAVEWLHHAEQVERTRNALHAEMRELLATVQTTQREDRCELVKLGELDAWARGGPKPDAKAMTLAGYSGSVWDDARAGGIVSLMGQDERLAFTRFYGGAHNHSTLVEMERQAARQVGGFRNLDRLQSADAQNLLRQTGEMRGILVTKIGDASRLIAAGRALGVTPGAPPAGMKQVVDDLCAETDRVSRAQAESR